MRNSSNERKRKITRKAKSSKREDIFVEVYFDELFKKLLKSTTN